MFLTFPRVLWCEMNLMANIRARRRRQTGKWSERGVAAVEFALTLPIWITIMLGVSDGTFYMVVNEKVDRISYSVTDIVTQYQTINKSQLADIVQAAQQLMQPLTFGANGVLVITSVYKSPSKSYPTICWQYTGGGTLTRASKIGTSNGNASCASGAQATLPNGLTLNDNDNIVITEVYYTFNPLFLSDSLFPGKDIYRVAVYKPRLSPLITPPT